MGTCVDRPFLIHGRLSEMTSREIPLLHRTQLVPVGCVAGFENARRHILISRAGRSRELQLRRFLRPGGLATSGSLAACVGVRYALRKNEAEAVRERHRLENKLDTGPARYLIKLSGTGPDQARQST